MNLKMCVGMAISFAAGVLGGIYIAKNKGFGEDSEYTSALKQEVNDLLDECRQLKSKLKKREMEKPDLAALAKKYKDEDFSEHVSDRISPSDDPPYKEPFMVTAEELDEYQDSEYSALTYYRGDSALVDENDEYVYNVGELLGENVAKMLSECDEDCIYVHNDAYDTNFEVVFDDGVYGMAEK